MKFVVFILDKFTPEIIKMWCKVGFFTTNYLLRRWKGRTESRIKVPPFLTCEKFCMLSFCQATLRIYCDTWGVRNGLERHPILEETFPSFTEGILKSFCVLEGQQEHWTSLWSTIFGNCPKWFAVLRWRNVAHNLIFKCTFLFIGSAIGACTSCYNLIYIYI